MCGVVTRNKKKLVLGTEAVTECPIDSRLLSGSRASYQPIWLYRLPDLIVDQCRLGYRRQWTRCLAVPVRWDRACHRDHETVFNNPMACYRLCDPEYVVWCPLLCRRWYLVVLEYLGPQLCDTITRGYRRRRWYHLWTLNLWLITITSKARRWPTRRSINSK